MTYTLGPADIAFVPDHADQLRLAGLAAQAEAGLDHALRALASIVGWRSVIHPDDHAVVRLALDTAKTSPKVDPDQGGSADLRDLVSSIEERWLDFVLS